MNASKARRSGPLAAALLALVTGCGDGGVAGGPGAEAERGGTVVLAENADMNLPVPLLSTGGLDGNLSADLLNMELVRGDWHEGKMRYLTADQSPMALARRYEYLGPDSTTLRFHMRSDVKWSDGRPLTAHDVVFSYNLVKNPALASPRQGQVEHLDSIVAQNDSTVTMYFDRRYPEMVSDASMAPVPRHLFEGADPARLRSHPAVVDPANGKLVVSGPFYIGSWQKGQQFTLVPNPHFQPQPNLDRIVIRVVPDPTTRQVELQTGAVDFVPAISFDQIPRVRAQAPHVRLEPQEKRFFDYIAYNPAKFEAFADPEIRRALGLAIDVPRMIRALQMEEYAVPAAGPFAPILTDVYDPETTPPLPYDPQRARQILEAKGWRDTNGDGIREKNGRPFRFTILTNTGNQRRADAMQIVQQQWRDIGVDAQLQSIEFNAFQKQVIMDRDYQAALGGWQVYLPSPDLTGLYGPDTPLNITGYRNPEVLALFDSASAQPTAEQANPYWKRAAARLVQDQPYTWLYYMDLVHGVNERVRDMEIDSYGYLQNAWEWWIPTAQQGTQPAQQTTERPAARPGAS